MTTKISSDNIQAATLNTLGGPKISTIGYPGDDTAANPAGGQTITLTGSGFENGASVIINNSAVGVVTVVSSTTITFTSPALATGSYPVYVVNTNGGTAIAVPGIQYSGVPTWSTAAGTLGTVYETTAFSNTVTATSDSSITYSLFSGTLPTGASLNSSNGLISGTSVATENSTTYTFTIRATDAEQQDTDRQFSLTVNPDVVTWSSPANGTSYSANISTAISNVVMSASSAAGYGITYTANTLPTGLSITGANIAGTPTVVGNTTTLLTATAATTNRTATRTISWVISVSNDIYFNLTTLLLNGEVGSTNVWNDDVSTNKFTVTVNGDTRPVAFSPYETVYSNLFDGTGDYFSLTGATALNFGTGDFTVELWVYFNSIAADRGFLGSASGGGYDFVWRTSTGLNIGRINTAFDNTFAWSPSANVWYHIAYSRSGSSLRVFVNGTQVGSTATNSIAYDGGGTVIIGGSTNSDRLMNGYISNMRLVKGTALYTSNFTPSTTPLTAIANTSLLICQSNRFIDNSTNNFTLTKNGDVTVSNFGPFVETDIITGSGYFDGTGDFLSQSSTGQQVSFGTGNFTIEAWIYWSSLSSESAVMFGSGVGWTLYIFPANKLQWGTTSPQTPANLLTGNTTLTVNQWYHIAVTRSGTTVTLWVNGVSDGTVADGNNYSANGTLNIGISHSSAYFTGYMSNVRIVKGTAAYTTNFTPPTSPLTAIANTSLLTLQYRTGENNNRFVDSSGINNIITRNGNATQGTFTPYSQTGWSGYFTGSSTSYIQTAATSVCNQGQTYTAQCWIYPTSFTTSTSAVRRMYIFVKGVIYAGLSIHSDGTLGWYGWPTPGGIILASSAGTITTNVWQHVAIVVNPSSYIKLFKNGVEVATSSYTAAGANDNAITIGHGDTGQGTDGFIGHISNFKVTPAALTSGQLDYAATPTISSPTNSSLMVLQSNRFVDNGPNALAITVGAASSVQSFSPFGPAIVTPTSYSGYFDGNGDYLTVPSNTGFSFGTGNFTVEAWVYLTATQNFGPIFISSSTGAGDSLHIQINSTNRVRITNASTEFLLATNAITLNTWTHVAVVRSGTTLSIYQDGVLNGNTTNSTSFTENAPTIGYEMVGGAYYFTGYISNLRVVKGTAVYTSNFTPSTTPLTAIANTSLLTCQSSTFIDNSTNNFTITVNGDTIPRSFNPFGNTVTTGTSAGYSVTTVGGSMYFDGTGDFLTAAYAINWSTFGTYSLEFWVYHTTISTLNSYAYASTGSAGYTNFYVYGSGGAYPAAVGVGIQGTNEIRTANNIITTNQWIHIAYTYDGTTTRIYINGVQQASSTTAVYSNNSANLSIANGLSGSLFVGYMAGFRLLRGIRVYTSSFAAPAAPVTPIANTTLLLNGTNGGIIDYTSKNLLETVGNSRTSNAIVKYGSRSLYFDGTGDYLSIPYSQNAEFGSGNWTIELWVYLNSTARQGFAALGDGAGSIVPWEIGVGSAGKFRLLVHPATGGQIVLDGTTTPTTGVWYHIAGVRNGNTATLYVNGTSEASNSSLSTTALRTLTNPALVGSYSYGFELNGYIDDLRITKGYARYTANFTPPTSALLTY